MSLFQKPAAASPTDKAAAAVDRVAQQHAAAEVALDRARADYADTLASVVAEDTADLRRLADARAALAAAESSERIARDALDATHARQNAAHAAQQRDAKAKAYDDAHKAAVKRAKVAKTLEAQAEALAASYRELVELGGTILTTLPDCPDIDGAVLRAHVIASALQVELIRQGLPLGAALQPRHEIPPIGDKLGTTPDLIARWKAEALA